MKFIHFIIIAFISFTVFSQTDLDVLQNSPRHQEWLELDSEGRTLYSFIVYPEIAKKAEVVIVIHENQGLSDWVRRFTDDLAAKGFIAIAPDLLSSTSSTISKTSDFRDTDTAKKALYDLKPEQVTVDLHTVFRYAQSIPAGTGEVSVIGFCWGGTQSFKYATQNPDLKKAFVFYGTAPTEAKDLAKIETPIYAFYGGDDTRVNSTIAETEKQMTTLGKFYSYNIYEGGGHGFMRSGVQAKASRSNRKAQRNAWKELLANLKS